MILLIILHHVLFFGDKKNIHIAHKNKAFDHDCTIKNKDDRIPPKVVSPQNLRNLRHYYGQIHDKEVFAFCPHCDYTWKHEEFVQSYLIKSVKVPSLTQYPDNTKRLKTMCINYQQGRGWLCMKSDVINSSYNIHNHTSSCFGKEVKLHNNKKLNSSIKKNPKCYECRYKYPRMPSKRTTINDVDDLQQNWFSWKGSCEQRSVKEINIKRKNMIYSKILVVQLYHYQN